MASKTCATKIKFNNLETSLLSWDGQIDAWGWNLPAGPNGACPLATDYGICRSCYSRGGMFSYDNVRKAQWIRFEWWKSLRSSEEGIREIVNTFVGAISRYCINGYFRVYISGDNSAPIDIEIWYKIVCACPKIKFWMPTRVWRATSDNWLTPLKKLASLPNISVKPSELDFNDKIVPKEGLDNGSTVITLDVAKDKKRLKSLNVAVCPKTLNHSDCKSEGCRKCWDKKSKDCRGTGYVVHGTAGRNQIMVWSDKVIKRERDYKEKFTQLTFSSKKTEI